MAAHFSGTNFRRMSWLYGEEGRPGAQSMSADRYQPMLEHMKRRLQQKQTFEQAIATILNDSMALNGAEHGTLQLVAGDNLLIVDQRRLKPSFLNIFRKVARLEGSACGRALRLGQTVVIEDIELDEEFASFRPAARAAGFRAVATTPLFTRAAELVGTVSTHFARVHRPTAIEIETFENYSVFAGDYTSRLLGTETLASMALKMSDQLYAEIDIRSNAPRQTSRHVIV
jgi:GAF domain